MDELRTPDFPVRWVLITIVAGFVLVGAVVGVITLTYGGARPSSFPQPSDLGAPRLETEPVANHEAWLARQRALLSGAEGRTPITEAMEAIAARGAEAYAPLPAEGGAQ
ncbi:hypothetical protein [Roseivivax sediminis]|uniref:Uncharacterized protein n=1 Tax=Roseivivax sediminis TaxID=936889 RepID=A0A1I1X8P1_9RHOB|nr:hypothetical protein [Roseivivax sediminis]SFE02063.1 hypothetical protein SAMN04515678_105224 [Roseivivax sediminis]